MDALLEPTLLLDKQKCLANMASMVGKASKLGITLRPHFKTHQSIEVARWFREFGIRGIAVSSLPMASYFASDGWTDILVAIPLAWQQHKLIDELSEKAHLTLTVSSLQGAKQLAKWVLGNVSVMLEVDTGQGRSGFNAQAFSEIGEAIASVAAKQHFTFKGFITHAGHSYAAPPLALETLNRKAIAIMQELKSQWVASFPALRVSYGDTPTSIMANVFEGVDELRPGNFVFFDMQMAQQGVCNPSSIAVALACRVIASYPQQRRAVVWAGAVHLSKDFYKLPDGIPSYGAVCPLNPDGTWGEPISNIYLESLSQEHGIIGGSNSTFFERIAEGQPLAILPAHSCLTVACMRRMTLAAEGRIISCMK